MLLIASLDSLLTLPSSGPFVTAIGASSLGTHRLNLGARRLVRGVTLHASIPLATLGLVRAFAAGNGGGAAMNYSEAGLVQAAVRRTVVPIIRRCTPSACSALPSRCARLTACPRRPRRLPPSDDRRYRRRLLPDPGGSRLHRREGHGQRRERGLVERRDSPASPGAKNGPHCPHGHDAGLVEGRSLNDWPNTVHGRPDFWLLDGCGVAAAFPPHAMTIATSASRCASKRAWGHPRCCACLLRAVCRTCCSWRSPPLHTGGCGRRPVGHRGITRLPAGHLRCPPTPLLDARASPSLVSTVNYGAALGPPLPQPSPTTSASGAALAFVNAAVTPRDRAGWAGAGPTRQDAYG